MYQSSVPRNMIVFLQVIGTVFAVAGLVAYMSMMTEVSNSIGGSEADSKALASLILALLVYFAWKSIYAAVVIVSFVKNSSDEDISANRFIISALSLNLGGFVTPFLVSMMPNVATKSNINPRWFLTKAMGITSLVGGVLSLAAFFISALTGQAGGLTSAQLFDTSQTAGIISLVILIVGLVTTAFGIISVALFYRKSSQQSFEENNATMNLVSVIWLAVVSIELFITMFFAVVRLIGALGDLIRAFRTEGAGAFLFVLIALFNLVVTAVYVGYILYLTSKAMIGIWSKDGIEYKPYQTLVNVNNRRANQSNEYIYA